MLHQPEIPPNTGNIIRLCANTGMMLHLIHPLSFSLEDKQLRRAGLDYHELACVREYSDFSMFLNISQPIRWFALTTKAQRCYAEVSYEPNDVLVFGSETRGLPPSILEMLPDRQKLRLPMRSGNRSLNLSNAVAVVIYEAWRQHGFLPHST